MNQKELAKFVDSLVGKPWSVEENCWWLVRHVFEHRFGIIMPEVMVADQNDHEQIRNLKLAAQASGWRPASGKPQDCDIVVVHGASGRHVGCMVQLGRFTRLLHCEGSVANPGPGVLWEDMESVLLRFTRPECWRMAPSTR